MSSALANEEFIIRGLEKKAEQVVKSLYGTWRRTQRIDPVFFTWPAVRIKTEAGEPHEGVCVLEMTMPKKEWPMAMRAMITRTEAYAILFIEQRVDSVLAILESSHGAKSWKLLIKNRGGLILLETPQRATNIDNLGLLWRPNQAQA